MLANILIIVAVAAVCALCIRSLIKGKKDGCSECGGNCAGCGKCSHGK